MAPPLGGAQFGGYEGYGGFEDDGFGGGMGWNAGPGMMGMNGGMGRGKKGSNPADADRECKRYLSIHPFYFVLTTI